MQKRYLLILVTSIFLLACSVKSSHVVVLEKDKFSSKTMLLLPVQNQNEALFKQAYPEAAQVVYEALETHLLALNISLVERNNMRRILQEQKLSQLGLSETEAIQVGKIVQADTLIFASINSYVQGKQKHPISQKIEQTRFGISIKAVQVETAKLLWKANIFRNIDTPFGYTSPVQNLMNEVLKELILELQEKGLGN
ncbi:MAG: CsgG/HfaB family protein [Spirochaetota bacterium]